jgi:hypothetical protein
MSPLVDTETKETGEGEGGEGRVSHPRSSDAVY